MTEQNRTEKGDDSEFKNNVKTISSVETTETKNVNNNNNKVNEKNVVCNKLEEMKTENIRRCAKNSKFHTQVIQEHDSRRGMVWFLSLLDEVEHKRIKFHHDAAFGYQLLERDYHDVTQKQSFELVKQRDENFTNCVENTMSDASYLRFTSCTMHLMKY